MKVIYFDCFSGISGDMILGALLDAGLDIEKLRKGLSGLGLKGYRLSRQKVKRQGIAGTKINILITTKQKPRFTSLKEITALIKKSKLTEEIKEISSEIFQNLARAERKVHGLRKAHFHQVGDIDSVIDIVGAVIGLKLLGIKKVYTSSLVLGRGYIAHGGAHSKNNLGGGNVVLPVPAPATISSLIGHRCLFSDQPYELVTPTGAAILSTLAQKKKPLPLMVPLKIGYGAGSRVKGILPNLLRVIIGETEECGYDRDKILVVEASIDDANPLVFERLLERLHSGGALDAYISNIQTKKARPGVLVTVLIPPHILEKISSIIFEETPTLGIRYYDAQRHKLRREIKKIQTEYGMVRVKLGVSRGEVITVSPEYDDCKKIAKKNNIPLRVIYAEAKDCARGSLRKKKIQI